MVARNLLSLRDIVEEGGLVILPHPTSWNGGHGPRTPTAEGKRPTSATRTSAWSSSLSVMNIIPHHPYNPFSRGKASTSMPTMQLPEEFSAISEEDYLFAKSMAGLFEDERFIYLNEAAPFDFYKAVTKDEHFYAENAGSRHADAQQRPRRAPAGLRAAKGTARQTPQGAEQQPAQGCPGCRIDTLMASGFAWLFNPFDGRTCTAGWRPRWGRRQAFARWSSTPSTNTIPTSWSARFRR